MEIVYSTEVLEAKTTKGMGKYWQGHVCREGNAYYTQTSSWQETKDGLSIVTHTNPTLVKGKNIGKANETTDEQQAHSEIQSEYNKKIDKAYHKAGEESEVLQQCMLASSWEKDKDKYRGKRLNCSIKLDGNRCLSDGTKMWSRSGKVFIPECINHILFDTKGYILDGELILPSKYGFQETSSAIKKFDPEITPHLEHWVYDIADLTKTFEQRYEILQELLKDAPANVKLVEVYPISSFDEVEIYHDKFVSEGYEGVMVRLYDGIYKPNTKSSSPLLKYKKFMDEEFRVIDFSAAVGQHEDAIIFNCVTKDGKKFDCGLKGSVEARKEMYANGASYIGKMLTVKFFGYTDDGIPRFPVGVRIRDYDLEG